ncbi:hypothetical protein ABZ593_21130 [Streptomyces sp. NPDC012617]|uniref:TRADD-N-associated membrane domain-containing protein n=1 Tax=Streptomyces TaxID=1883 RepID=UPI0033F91BED
MSTAPDSDRPEPPPRGRWFSNQRHWILTALAFASFIATLTVLELSTGKVVWLSKLVGGPAEALDQVSVFTAIAAVTGLTLRQVLAARDRERQTVDRSRERLNRAEGELEQALRAAPSAASLTARLAAQIAEAAVPSASTVPPPYVRLDPSSDSDHEEPSDDVPRGQNALALAELWTTTHARLTLYHDIATGQAKVSFRNAQIAMGIGFALLVLFVVLALNASTTAGAIVAGGLGAVSAALSGFVAKTFIRSQEAAATHLRSYFDQPLELSRFLAAERLIADGGLTQEQRGEVLLALVQAMVAAPAPPPSPMVVASVPGQQGA